MCLLCFTVFSLVVVSRGYSLAAVCGLLTAVASLEAEYRLLGAQASVVAACRIDSVVATPRF